MLLIRTEQMVALEQAQVDRFTDDLVNHVRSFAPDRYVSLGKDPVRKIINLGLRNADRHGFTLRGPVRFYLESMFMLGSFFDTDPQYRDVTRTLFDDRGADEIIRADLLYDHVMNYVDAAAGPGYEFERRARNKSANLSYEQITSLAGHSPVILLESLSQIHPKKVQALGKPAILALVSEAWEFAAQFGPSWAAAAPLFSLLMFILGSNCFADPQFPWLVRALDRPDGLDPDLTPEGLFGEFVAFLTPPSTTSAKSPHYGR